MDPSIRQHPLPTVSEACDVTPQSLPRARRLWISLVLALATISFVGYLTLSRTETKDE